MFYLNLKEKGKNYKNKFKYWTYCSYLLRYSDSKQAFCAEISVNFAHDADFAF